MNVKECAGYSNSYSDNSHIAIIILGDIMSKITEEKNALLFLSLLHSFGIEKPEREHRFHDTRRFRFDFAWPKYQLAVEIEGGIWINGGHNRGVGYSKDMEKYNLATLRGWRILRFAPKDIKNENTYAMIRECLK